MGKYKLEFYETKDAVTIYAQGIKGKMTLGTIKNNTIIWRAGYKYKDDIVMFDSDSISYYNILGKVGNSRLFTGTMGALFGPIASAASMQGGLGSTYLVCLELRKVKKGILILKCHEDFFKYIRSSCRKSNVLSAEAERVITESKVIQEDIAVFKKQSSPEKKVIKILLYALLITFLYFMFVATYG